jgi:hypothetical protein
MRVSIARRTHALHGMCTRKPCTRRAPQRHSSTAAQRQQRAQQRTCCQSCRCAGSGCAPCQSRSQTHLSGGRGVRGAGRRPRGAVSNSMRNSMRTSRGRDTRSRLSCARARDGSIGDARPPCSAPAPPPPPPSRTPVPAVKLDLAVHGPPRGVLELARVRDGRPLVCGQAPVAPEQPDEAAALLDLCGRACWCARALSVCVECVLSLCLVYVECVCFFGGGGGSWSSAATGFGGRP